MVPLDFIFWSVLSFIRSDLYTQILNGSRFLCIFYFSFYFSFFFTMFSRKIPLCNLKTALEIMTLGEHNFPYLLVNTKDAGASNQGHGRRFGAGGIWARVAVHRGKKGMAARCDSRCVQSWATGTPVARSRGSVRGLGR